MTLAEALVYRKTLENKVKQLEPVKINGEQGLFELHTERRTISQNDGIDELKIQVPKTTLADVTAEYDKYSKALRLLDTAIQKTNWETEVKVELPENLAV